MNARMDADGHGFLMRSGSSELRGVLKSVLICVNPRIVFKAAALPDGGGGAFYANDRTDDAFFCVLGGVRCVGRATGVDAGTRQLIVAIAPDWDTDHGMLRLYERDPGGPWRAVTEAWPVLLGKNGLAWGRGVAGQDEPGLHKQRKISGRRRGFSRWATCMGMKRRCRRAGITRTIR